MKFCAHIKDQEEVLSWFKRNEPEFYTRSTNYSTTVRAPKLSIVLCERAIGFPVLGMIQRVRTEARKWQVEHETGSDLVEGKLFNVKEVVDSHEIPVYIYDKSAAYATASRDAGIISQESFDKLARMPKQLRLMIIGSIGTRATIRQYREGKCIDTKQETQATRPVWERIIATVSAEMLLHYTLNRAIFAFWVDALYSLQPVRLDKSFREKVVSMRIRNSSEFLSLYVRGSQYLKLPKKGVMQWQNSLR